VLRAENGAHAHRETALHVSLYRRARRMDHRQQDSGQHVLSAAFLRLHGVRTLSFHLGAVVSTIDLAREVTPAEITAAEGEANRIVWEDRPVHDSLRPTRPRR
jgi:Ser-tRNA(Ala) deacylase AlaX